MHPSEVRRRGAAVRRSPISTTRNESERRDTLASLPLQVHARLVEHDHNHRLRHSDGSVHAVGKSVSLPGCCYGTSTPPC